MVMPGGRGTFESVCRYPPPSTRPPILRRIRRHLNSLAHCRTVSDKGADLPLHAIFSPPMATSPMRRRPWLAGFPIRHR